jgi:glycosyltransferase involved in cell wall biosynthesis
MRIMLFIGQLTRGGAERQFALLAGELVKRGHDVCFVTLTDKGDCDEYRELMVRAERRVLFKRRHPGPLRFVQLSRGWSPFRVLVKDFRPDVVYSALEWTNFIASRAIASMRDGPAFVAGIRSDNWVLGDVPWRRRHPNTCLAKHSRRFPIDALIANSSRGLKNAQEIGFHATLNRVVWNGIDSIKFARNAESGLAFRRACGIPEDALLIGHVGRLDPQKDHRTLFEAFVRLRTTHPLARLLCVGSGTDEFTSSLRDLASGMNISDAVIWRSRVDDMSSVYSAMDCYVQSSLSEGFPNVLAEAMSCCVRCVATDVGESNVLMGDEGSVVPHGDPESLCEGILAALTRPTPSASSRERIVDMFSVDRMVDATLEVFDEVL